MTIVDSSVWIDFFNGKETPQTEKLEKLLYTEPISIGDIILTEVLQGFNSDPAFETAKNYLTQLPCHTLLNPVFAILSAINYRKLRKKGITIRKTIDMIIATFCIENGYTLLHSDRDFDLIQEHLGLKVY